MSTTSTSPNSGCTATQFIFEQRKAFLSLLWPQSRYCCWCRAFSIPPRRAAILTQRALQRPTKPININDEERPLALSTNKTTMAVFIRAQVYGTAFDVTDRFAEAQRNALLFYHWELTCAASQVLRPTSIRDGRIWSVLVACLCLFLCNDTIDYEAMRLTDT